MTSTGRVARLTALALATGTLVAAGAGTAGAATTQKTDFTATGGGSVIHLEINLPSQLAPVLDAAGLPHSLIQDIVLTGGSTRTNDLQAIATSTLGANGNVPVLKDLLNKSVTAQFGKNGTASYSLLPQELKDGLAGFGISVKALDLNSTANNPTVDGTVSHSQSTVANLTVAGTGVLDSLLAALNTQLQSVINTALGTTGFSSSTSSATGTAAAVTDAAQGVLGSTLTTINAVTGNALQGQTDAVQAQIKAAVNQVLAALTDLPNLINGQLKSTADTSLLKVGLIESEQAVDRAAGVVTSTSSNKLVGVSVLGGLITVDGLSSMATAALGNGVSEATADKGQNALLKVNVRDLLSVEVTNGLQATLGSPVLPAGVVTAVNDALAQITQILNGVLGATLTQTEVGTLVEKPDHASSSVSAARLVVNPTIPGVGAVFGSKPLLDISFVPATADVVKAQASVPPTITPAKATSQHQFARTGANFGLTAPIAVALMGLAVVARRRRLAHLGE